MANGFLNLFKGFKTKSEKPLKEKKRVHPELQEEVKKKVKKTLEENYKPFQFRNW